MSINPSQTAFSRLDLDGMSGAPVFSIDGSPGNYIVNFRGTILRGGNGHLHYIDAAAICRILQKAEALKCHTKRYNRALNLMRNSAPRYSGEWRDDDYHVLANGGGRGSLRMRSPRIRRPVAAADPFSLRFNELISPQSEIHSG